MRNRILSLVLLAASISLGIDPLSRQADRLPLEEARAYMLQLINRDRATKDLLPVALDLIASSAGQKHADEMAAQRYLSHYNLAGKPPDQRYTDAGGTSYDRENVYLSTTRYRGEAADANAPLPLLNNAAFTRREIEEIEASYLNETPPHDGHRRNILAPEHTHVGIGLARAGDRNVRTLGNAQEFVDKYIEADPIPISCGLNDEITISGKKLGSARFRSIGIGRAPLPAAMTREQLAETRSYTIPSAHVTYWPAPYKSLRRVQATPGGRFSVTAPPAYQNSPGLYYVAIWVEENGRDLLASLRTIVVK